LTQHAEIFPDLTSHIELQIALAIGPDNFYIRHRQSIADLFADQTTGNESEQRLPISFNLATGELCYHHDGSCVATFTERRARCSQ